MISSVRQALLTLKLIFEEWRFSHEVFDDLSRVVAGIVVNNNNLMLQRRGR